jgi:hypothetical protein
MAATDHGTLTADEIKTVTVTAGREGVVIVNRTQTGVIWVRIDGEDPAEEAADSYAVFGVREFPLSRTKAGLPMTIKMLSNADKTYTVEAY